MCKTFNKYRYGDCLSTWLKNYIIIWYNALKIIGHQRINDIRSLKWELDEVSPEWTKGSWCSWTSKSSWAKCVNWERMEGRADSHAFSTTVVLNLWVKGPFQRPCLRLSELTCLPYDLWQLWSSNINNVTLRSTTTWGTV